MADLSLKIFPDLSPSEPADDPAGRENRGKLIKKSGGNAVCVQLSPIFLLVPQGFIKSAALLAVQQRDFRKTRIFE